MSVAVVALFCAVVPSDALAWRGLATVSGMVQGPIQGDSTSKDGNGAVVIKEIGFQMNRAVDPLSGLPSGQARFQPFALMKEPDRATPKLLKAAATAERMTDVIDGTSVDVTP